jgi:hypothetical protein
LSGQVFSGVSGVKLDDETGSSAAGWRTRRRFLAKQFSRQARWPGRSDRRGGARSFVT